MTKQYKEEWDKWVESFRDEETNEIDWDNINDCIDDFIGDIGRGGITTILYSYFKD